MRLAKLRKYILGYQRLLKTRSKGGFVATVKLPLTQKTMTAFLVMMLQGERLAKQDGDATNEAFFREIIREFESHAKAEA